MKCIECNKREQFQYLRKAENRTITRKLCRSCIKRGEIKRGVFQDSSFYSYRSHKINSCQSCGFEPINICQLDIDHKDGNHRNNNVDNLQTLCANCHRLKTFLNNEGIYQPKL